MRRLVVCLSLTVFAIVGLQVHAASATAKITASRSQLAKSCAKMADSSCYNCQGRDRQADVDRRLHSV
jgi:cytochrome c553